MKLHLPNSAFLGNIDAFIKSFDPSEPEKLLVSANQKWIALHPFALAMVGSLGLKVRPEVTCQNMVAKSAHYLERMKLFEFLGVNCGITVTEHEPAGRFIPLTQIKDSDDLTRFITEIDPLLHLEPNQARAIKYVVSELVRNVLEHSYSSDGAIVAAQYFKKSNKIGIGIADTGIGIRESISRSWSAKSDLEAIGLALTPGITGTTKNEGGTEQNAGAGLFFIKSIASVNKNFFVLYSGDALYKLLRRSSDKLRLHANPFRDRHTAQENLPRWQGTVVGIDISLDQSKEFVGLLEAIRETYEEAVRERKKANIKKPRFV